MSTPSRTKINSLLLLIGAVAIGCTPKTPDGPFGPADDSPLLSPFAGKWVFDFDKTLAAQKAAGMTDEQIAQLRKLYADNPRFGKMHPDLTINGNLAVDMGIPSSEYRCFSMHAHGANVCGKAWHHEDRFDPGDMSKCYVRLRVVDGDLHLDVNMLDGLPDVNDPDLRSTPAVEGDSSKCDADTQDAADWATYIFARGV